MSNQINNLYEFGPFQLDPSERLLLRDGEPVALTPKAFDTLVVLVERSGRLVDKDELMNEVWHDTIVEEVGLARNISSLRKALGEDTSSPQYIETVPKSGYRFIAEVKQIEIENTDLIVARHTQTHIVVDEKEEHESDYKEKIIEDIKLLPPKSSLPFLTASLLKVAGIVAVVLISLTVIFYFTRNFQTPQDIQSNPPLKSVAVLPFHTINSQSDDDDFIVMGMTDNLIYRLGNLRKIIVRPTSSVLRYNAANVDAVAVGRELKVDAVVEGSFQRFGDRVRLTVRLVGTRDGTVMWTGKFDEKFTDVLSMQDSLSNQIAKSLELKLNEDERKLLAKRYTQDTEAYQAYLKGRYFWEKKNETGFRNAIKYFEQAVKIDPNYALAYTGLADSYLMLNSYGIDSPNETFPKAMSAVLKTLEIDNTLAEAHTSLGYLKRDYAWDFKGAENEFKKAIELKPNYVTARHWYAEFLVLMGRSEEALIEIQRALEIDPLSLNINAALGFIYFYTRNYDEAIKQLRKTLELDSDFLLARLYLGLTLEQKGMYDEAKAEIEQINPQFKDGAGLAILGHLYAKWNRTIEAQKMLDELVALSKKRYVPPAHIAVVYLGMENHDKALDMLEKAFDERSSLLIFFYTDPRSDKIRNDPRFIELMNRMGIWNANTKSQTAT